MTPVRSVKRSDEAVGIIAAHGVADGVTTVLAARAVGVSGEANPIVRWALTEIGEPWTFVAMMAIVTIAAIGWTVAAEIARSPSFVGWAVAAVGAVVAGTNVAVAYGPA